MPVNMPTITQYKKLYNLMEKIKEMKPWDWMNEFDFFGVQDPDSKEIGFVSTMGASGEHYAVAVYLGEEGLNQYYKMSEGFADPLTLFQNMIELPHLHASFENRNFLFKEDYDMIKQLGLSYRGKNSWPMFRSHQPGFVPWFINEEEAGFLIYVLEQTIDVATRAKDNTELLYPGEDFCYLLRKPVKNQKRITWKDAIWCESMDESQSADFFPDKIAFEKLKMITRNDDAVELDIFMSQNPVQEKDEVPCYPYILLILDTTAGIIIRHKFLMPLPSLTEMWQKMPSEIANLFSSIPLMPQEIYVDSFDLYQSLLFIKEYYDLNIHFVEKLIHAPELKSGYMNYLSKENL